MIQVLVDGGEANQRRWAAQAVRAALEHQGASEGEVSVALLDDPAIQALNRDHLGHDYPTDVLSFALWSEGEPVVGDIYIGVDQALRQASEAGVPPREEIARLAVHGTLHVLGHDHPEAAQDRPTSPMYRLQEAILASVLGGP